MLTIHVIICGAPHDVCIQHPTLDRKAAFGEMLPGMATLDRRPVDVQRLEAGTERHKDLRMVTHDFLGGSPLDEGLMKDLDHPTEILSLGAAGSHTRPAVAIEDEKTREPLALDLDQIPHVDTPHVMGCSRWPRTFCGIGGVGLPLGGGMRLFIEGHDLPHGGVAIPIPQGIQGHLHPVVPQQRMVVQEAKDLHHDLERDARRDRRSLPCPRGQAQQAEGGQALAPVIDDRGIDRQPCGDPAGAEPDLSELDDSPPGLFFCGICVVGAKAQKQVFRAEGLFQALRIRGGLEG
jgi:hypothetical protein